MSTVVARVSVGSERGCTACFGVPSIRSFFSSLPARFSRASRLDGLLGEESLLSLSSPSYFLYYDLFFFSCLSYLAPLACAAPPMRLIRGHAFCEDTRVRGAGARNTHSSALRCSRGDETKREPASVSPFRPKFCVTGRVWVARGFFEFQCIC